MTINIYSTIGVPNAPKLVSVTCENTSALVAWLPMGDNRAPINRVIIEYNTSFTPDIWQVAYNESVTVDDPNLKVCHPSIRSMNTSVTCNTVHSFQNVPLSPWVNYTFRVTVVNRVGPSLTSGVSKQCETPPDVPFKNPDNVEGKSDNKSNFVISWTVREQQSLVYYTVT